MANYHEIPKPPKPKGDAEKYNNDLYNYLSRLAETLQAVLNAITTQMEGGTANANSAER